MTKKYSRLHLIFTLASLLLNIFPFAFYVTEALLGGAATVEKVALTSTLFVVLVMTLVALVNKKAMRSRLWILLIGLYVCLDNILTPLLMISICQIIDEVVVSPLAKVFRVKKTIHRELDKRE